MRTAAILGFLFLAVLPGFPQTTPGATQSGSAPAGSAPAGSAPGTTGTGAAPAAPARPDDLPRDSSASWRVGISAFSSHGLSADNAYLPFSLALLLKNELAGLTPHAYSEQQIGLARRSLVTAEVTSAEKSITAARKDRDNLLFNQVPAGDASWTSADKRVAAAQARLEFLRGLDPVRVQVADSKPVSIVEGSGAGKLLDVPDVPPGAYCARQGLDLLIGGSVEEVQDYLLLDVWAFDPLSGTEVFSARNAASRDELYASIPAFGREIARTILGRSWALVVFAPDPPDAALYVDGVLAASGATPVLYLAPGTHDLRLQAPGYLPVSRTADLAEDKETRIADSLEKTTTGTIAVSSDPAGADLYVDSYWIGKTPLTLDRPPVRSRGILFLKGFYDSPFSLGPTSPPALSFALQKDVGSKDVQRTKARDDFYRALGFFAFSLPLPAFSYGLAIDFAVKQFDLDQAGMGGAAGDARTVSIVFLGSYYAGIAVSAALFTWMVTRIVHYVTVANEMAD
jgi:hypothetical protein